MYVEDVTFEGFNVVWTCPCSDWSSVDKYNLNLVASDGEIDYTHVSRTDGKCPNFTQNILTKRGLQNWISFFKFFQTAKVWSM